MPASEIQQNSSESSKNSPKKFWLCFAFLFVFICLLHGRILPYSNEYVYLLRLEPNFLPNDWTFSFPAHEHWLFNFLFGLPARIFSIETVGWLGRIAGWTLCLAALIKLGKRWAIPFWAIGVSIFLWLAFGQSIVGEEWIFDGFEAKVVAYVCLLFALEGFCERKIFLPSILLGLSFSFHPAIGLWAISAIGLALLFEKIALVDFVKVVGLTAMFSLFGLIPLFVAQSNGAAFSFDDWQFVILYRISANVDMFQFSKSGTILLFVMLGFNIYALWKSESFALRLLLKFQIALGAFFLFGFLLRSLEIYQILRLMPMRLFPVFTPLFFLFTVFYKPPRLESKNVRIGIAAFAIVAIVFLNPFSKTFYSVRDTIETWRTTPDDFQKSAMWIQANAPVDALILEPPNRRDWWYFSRRASVVSFAYPTYERLSEWRTRVADLSGNLAIKKNETASDEIETAFNQLGEAQIEQLKNKYATTHLVSRAEYSYPVIYRTETYKVYLLR